MSAYLTLTDLFKNSRISKPLTVLLRLDLNMPIQNNRIADDTRLVRSLPTINELLSKNCKVVILSHFGRPNNMVDPSLSLCPIAHSLRKYFRCPILFSADCDGPSAKMALEEACPGSIVVLENLRFQVGEEANDPDFTRRLSQLGDIYVNDGFSVSHRAHASIVGIPNYLPAYAGQAFEAELDALDRVLGNPQRPVMAIVGGAKVSTKLELLKNLISKVDYLVLGGGMANTFLGAKGVSIGNSLQEKDLYGVAKEIILQAQKLGCNIILPVDAVVAQSLKGASPKTISIEKIADQDCIFDVGPETLGHIDERLDLCKTVLWNGPLGIFEVPPYDASSKWLATSIAKRTLIGLMSVAGGGDTLLALQESGFQDKFSYTSTAGGAFLEWLEGKVLPGVEVLQKNVSRHCEEQIDVAHH